MGILLNSMATQSMLPYAPCKLQVSPSIRMLQLHGVWYSGGSLGLMPWITCSNRSTTDNESTSFGSP